MQPVPEITGKTVFIPLIGHPVEQVKSPGPVNAWFSDNDVGAVLIPVDIFPEKVAAFLDAIRGTPNCPGVSVTMPHKQAACAGVDDLTDRARRAGAVNIIRRRPDGTLLGDMVDGDAMVAALAKNGVTVTGKTALVVGAGGAGTAIIYALAEAGAATIVVIERDRAKADRLTGQLRRDYPELHAHDVLPDGIDVDIAVNASPAGMNPADPYPFPLERLTRAEIIADAVTKPPVTPWLEEARRRGIAIQAGAEMTLAQLPTQIAFWGLDKGDRDEGERR
ncbi:MULTISPECIES: shikimate dehydrogenase family protein [Sinorhizobium]|uniref:shikimate dehydrogenase (NADP(+)) n=2 Tax=Sinorhizobium TaxID=28105 RepID=A0A2S3YV73_9HYPH|nr:MULTISPECIES: shikimate dehydrogenase [Sinorhizobium]ASY60513.1 Shikimate 5-dehydrogenase I alpha [Sinorhizobium sp. CCBAU 05631]AUX80693.1 shikimate 5-dehydrogenase protein [Sinorhizobium fredii]PDT39602.1 shikimate dehydrogenase [Sinorhizobium sp. FG01]PDT51326.1 shikimate dehydrogenase [Sinorhizobium sp. NG07B]POH25977.1 shikimate dehydrogenase [Sinorhizobium americanum]